MTMTHLKDQRIYESRKLLKIALINLLEDKDISKISVTELSKVSGVSRSTYYRNHDSLEDILLIYLRDWYLETFIHIIQTEGTETLAYSLFQACESELPLFKAIAKCQLDYAIMMDLKQSIELLLSDTYQAVTMDLKDFKAFFNQDYPYNVYAFAGHSYATMRYWIDHPKLTALEVSGHYEGYFM